jgi:RNA polymerase sigma-70 factor, ECF subfamily
LKSWLFTIMRNSFLNEVHKTRREHPGFEACASDSRSIGPSQEWAVRLREVETALKTLSPDFLTAVMAACAGDSCEDTAKTSGCAVGTIKSRTSRARHQILVEMDETERR